MPGTLPAWKLASTCSVGLRGVSSLCLGSGAGEVALLSSHTSSISGLARRPLSGPQSHHPGGPGLGAGWLSQSHRGPPVERACQLLCPQSHFDASSSKPGASLRTLTGAPCSSLAPARSSSHPQPQGSSAGSPGLGASRLLTSHWPRASGKQSRGRAAGQLRGRHLGGKFRGRATGGAEGGEVPGVGRPGGERASRAAGRRRAGRRRPRRGERARRARVAVGGAVAEGSSSPVPSPPQLSSGRGGAGYVERGRAGRSPLRVRPQRTRGARLRRPLAGSWRQRRRCGGRGGVHERRRGGAERGGWPVRCLLEWPGGGERAAARQARGRGPSGAGERPGAGHTGRPAAAGVSERGQHAAPAARLLSSGALRGGGQASEARSEAGLGLPLFWGRGCVDPREPAFSLGWHC